jgi:hypothetical protein
MMLLAVLALAASAQAFRVSNAVTRRYALNMVAASQVKAAMPTAEDWLTICEPGHKKAIMGMFRAVKEIAYKIRTASCDKMACFNEFGYS